MDRPFPAYSGSESFSFVCYAHVDAKIVYPDMQWLGDHDIRLWYDEGISAGKNWRTEIGESLQQATRVLFYISKASLASVHCNREINFALDEGIEIIPVYLEDVELTTDLKIGLTRVQALHHQQDAMYQQHLLDALGSTSAGIGPQKAKRRKNRSMLAYAIPVSVIILISVGWWYQQPDREPVHELESKAAASPLLTAVAVLPFDDLSPGADQAWLVNGMAESLIESLSRIEALRVPGRTSTTSLKKQGSTIQSIGEQLGVGTVVEGSIRQNDERLYVVAKLIRVEGEAHLWSSRYDKPFNDIFKVQQEIAEGIAEAIRAELGIRDSYDFMMRTRYQPADPRAWENFQKAYELWRTFDPVKIMASADFCNKAIEIDPAYAAGYSCLATTYFVQGSAARAIELSERALELDPSDSMANWVIGRIGMSRWAFTATEERLKRTIEANPNDINVGGTYASLLVRTGHHQAAFKEAMRIAKIEPLMPVSQANVARSLVLVGDYETALEKYEYAKTLGPIPVHHHLYAAIANHYSGNHNDALNAVVRWARKTPEEGIRAAFDHGGWSEMMLYIAENSPLPACSSRYSPSRAFVFGYAGRKERMYACIEEQMAAEATGLPETLYRKFGFEEFWDEPRFQDILQRLNERIGGGSVRIISDYEREQGGS